MYQGLIFFILTAAVIPGLPMGALAPRWAVVSLFAAYLFFHVRISTGAWVFLVYLCVMAWVTPIGYDAAYVGWHVLVLTILFVWARDRASWYGREPTAALASSPAPFFMRPIAIGCGFGFALNSAAVIAQYFGWKLIPQIAPLSGLYYNHNQASEGAALTAALVVGYRLWWLVPGLLPTLAVGSRTPLLALGAAALLGLWRRDRFLAMLSALGFALIAAAFTPSWATPFQSLTERFGVWQDALHGLTFWGRGLGSWIGEFPRWQLHSDPLFVRYEEAHNDYLQVIFDLGVPGVLLILATVGALWRASRTPEWYACLVFAVMAFFGFPLQEPATGALLVVCAGSLSVRGAALLPVFDAERCRVRLGAAYARFAALYSRGPAVSAGEDASFGSGLHRESDWRQSPYRPYPRGFEP
jgi:hypothetical protein